MKKVTKKRRVFPKELVKEYGEQTYRDYKRHNEAFKKYGPCKGNRNFPNSRHTYKDVAWSSAYVAEGCGYIEQSDIEAFHRAIVRYATTHRFPKNFI